MRKVLEQISSIVAGGSLLYGIIRSSIAFFELKICEGSSCQSLWAGIPPGVVVIVFLVAFIPLSPMISIIYAWPGYLLAAGFGALAGVRIRPRVVPGRRRPWYATLLLALYLAGTIYNAVAYPSTASAVAMLPYVIGAVAVFCWRKWGVYLLMITAGLRIPFHLLRLAANQLPNEDPATTSIYLLVSALELCLFALAIYPLRKQM